MALGLTEALLAILNASLLLEPEFCLVNEERCADLKGKKNSNICLFPTTEKCRNWEVSASD